MRRKLLIMGLLVAFITGLFGCSEKPAEESGGENPTGSVVQAENCSVHILALGKADAILILADGHSMLIDAGYEENSDKVISYLKEQGVSTLDYVVLTHGDRDHVGGMAAVLEAFSVKQLYVNPRSEKSTEYMNMVKVVEKKSIPTSVPAVGTTFELGKGKFKVTAPGEKALKEDKDNDASLVLHYTYGSRSFFFMGDAGGPTEKEMESAGLAYVCDVLKVGHHGKDDGTKKKFLKTVAPLYAVITCGEIQGEDESGEPDYEVLKRLEELKITTYRTDENGTVVFDTDGEKLTVRK